MSICLCSGGGGEAGRWGVTMRKYLYLSFMMMINIKNYYGMITTV